MMDRIDRYILGHMLGPFAGALIGVLALLMLERMLRVIELVSENNGAIAFVFDMLASLVPHYLGLAAPAALFVACYVGYRRLAQTSELAALASIGRGLGRLAVPALAMALVLTATSIFVHSYLQPHGRYAYRTLKFVVANASIATALEAGAFIQFGDVTFMAEQAGPGKRALGKVFVHERREDGGQRTISSTAAALVESEAGNRSAIKFRDGLMVDAQPDGGRGVVAFERFDWPIDRAALGEFRPRGGSEAEMTWPELYAALDTEPNPAFLIKIEAELHAKVARALSVAFIPFLAIPLAVAGGRTRSSIPLALGIVGLLFFVQSLQFAEEMADNGIVPAAPTIWTVFAIFAIGSTALFLRAWRSVGFGQGVRWPQRPRIERLTRLRRRGAT